jgi:hypothetical protein
MKMKWVIPVVVLLIVAAVVIVLWEPWNEKGPKEVEGPEIVRVDFPQQIQADGSKVTGTVHFRDPDGDIVKAKFEVVEAQLFDPFEFDPKVQGQKEGSFQFFIFTMYPQKVILRVTLIDSQGHVSEPLEFSFEAVLPES